MYLWCCRFARRARRGGLEDVQDGGVADESPVQVVHRQHGPQAEDQHGGPTRSANIYCISIRCTFTFTMFNIMK